MKSLWLTYAWDDNKNQDVDYLAQELKNFGIEVKLDRWNLGAGKPLWQQIESFIQKPENSDGWVIYATQTSLGSEKCKEEYRYALDRALATRGSDFPIIALFQNPVADELIPAGIKTRLFVSLTDVDWKERIKASLEKRAPKIEAPNLEPYEIKFHTVPAPEGKISYAIEVRPRVGSWCPFIAGIPLSEKDKVKPTLGHGPRGRVPVNIVLINWGESDSKNGELYLLHAGNEATPTQSYFLLCEELPSSIMFGINGGTPQYSVKINK